MPQVGAAFAAQDAGHATADVADVGGARPEVLVIDRRQHARLRVRAGEDRDIGGDAGIDRGQRRDRRCPGSRANSAWASKIGADLLAGSGGDLAGQCLEVVGGRLERGLEARPFERRVDGRRRGRARSADPRRARTTSSRPTPTPGEPTRPVRTERVTSIGLGSASVSRPVGGDDVGQGAQQQRGRGGARILVADAALAEVRRPALRREHRDRRLHAGFGGIGDRRRERRQVGTGCLGGAAGRRGPG